MADKVEYRREALAKFAALTAKLNMPGDTAILLERGCYNSAIKANMAAGQSIMLGSLEFMSRYDAITTRTLINLAPDSTVGSQELQKALESGLAPINVGGMTSAELTPSVNADIRQTLEIRSKQKVVQKISTAYRCKKCGQSKTTFEEYQGRAGDEASNFSFKCLYCYHTWHK